jgi:hypothetical protein
MRRLQDQPKLPLVAADNDMFSPDLCHTAVKPAARPINPNSHAGPTSPKTGQVERERAMARHVERHPPNPLFTPLEARLLMMLLALAVTVAAILVQRHL